MEVKKSLKADLEGMRSTSLLIGFVLVLATMFVAFEWTQRDRKAVEDTEPVFTAAIEEDMIPISHQEEVAAPPPAAAPKIAEIPIFTSSAASFLPFLALLVFSSIVYSRFLS